jgi:hypothetical protein
MESAHQESQLLQAAQMTEDTSLSVAPGEKSIQLLHE